MPDKTWKSVERRYASIFGGERGGPTGEVDIVHPTFAPEVKHRKKVAKWFKEMVDQAQTHAPDGKLPFVVLHEKHQRLMEGYVIMTVGDFVDWFGDIEE